MRQSDVPRQIQRLIDAQCVYRLGWSARWRARIQAGKNPLVCYVPPKLPTIEHSPCYDVPAIAGGRAEAVEAGQARQARQAEAAVLRAAVIAALQAGQARQAAAEAARYLPAGIGILPYGRAEAKLEAGTARLVAGRHGGHVQDRSIRLRGGRARGTEAKTMIPASDIARLTCPRSADVQSAAVFFRGTAGTDYSLTAALRRAGTIDDTICRVDNRNQRLSLRPVPKPKLWTAVQTGKSRQSSKSERQAAAAEAGTMYGSSVPRMPIVAAAGQARRAELDDMQAEAARGQAGGRQRQAAAVLRGGGSGRTEAASTEALQALEDRQFLRQAKARMAARRAGK